MSDNTSAVRCLQARDQLLAIFRTKHQQRLERIAEDGPLDYEDVKVCRMAALFVMAELKLPDGAAGLQRAAGGPP